MTINKKYPSELIIKTLKRIDPNFERDDLGLGYGIKTRNGRFIRVKPFWISDREIIESEILKP